MGRPVVSDSSIGFSQTVLQSEVQSSLAGGEAAESETEAPQTTPPLGILEKFESHTFCGFGFNTIFRPHSTNPSTPTPLAVTPPAGGPVDNILQLNLTKEMMKFDLKLGAVPNRGLFEQADINLNGVPYTQIIKDMMDPHVEKPVIHFENGVWVHVPATTTPTLPASLARMGSIPHGTAINAQSFSEPVTSKGAPVFQSVDITPFTIGNPNNKIHFNSQDVADKDTFRIPQDLTPFVNAQSITQDILNNPNIILSNANKGKDIIEHSTYTIATRPPLSKLGGGTSNIGFLIGDASQKGANRANANAVDVTVSYWVSTVRAKLQLTPFTPTSEKPTTTFSPLAVRENDALPVFTVDFPIPHDKEVTVEYTQLQYSQLVLLDFANLSWPHATVSTLAPTDLKLQASVLQS